MVKVEYLALYAVCVFERAGVKILLYSLGHTADDQVEAKIVHDFSVHRLANGLYFVETHTLTGIKSGGKIGAQIGEEHVEVVLVVFEQILDVVAHFEEVDKDVAFVFILGKLLHDVAFAYTAGSLYHHG